jgi:predicted N-acetyltransferase YhbS
MIRLLTELSGLDGLSEKEPVLAAMAASSAAAFLDDPERLRCFGEYDETGSLVAAADLTSRIILLLCGASGLSGEMTEFLKRILPGGDFTGILCGERALPVLKKEFPIREHDEAVMACSSLIAPPAAEFRAEPPRHFSDVWELLAGVDEGFAKGDRETRLLRTSRGARRGQTTVQMIYDGELPAAAASIRGRCKTCGVIAGVATREEYRRRGMASYLTYLCTKELLDSGRTAWLVPSGEPSARLYEALGFRRVSSQYFCKLVNEEPT